MGASNASARRRRHDVLVVLLTVLMVGGTWSTGLAASRTAGNRVLAAERSCWMPTGKDASWVFPVSQPGRRSVR
jgi:hypothetical protein